jgi:hypothetical protein
MKPGSSRPSTRILVESHGEAETLPGRLVHNAGSTADDLVVKIVGDKHPLRCRRVTQGTEVQGLAQQQRAVNIPQHGTKLLVSATGLIPVFSRHVTVSDIYRYFLVNLFCCTTTRSPPQSCPLCLALISNCLHGLPDHLFIAEVVMPNRLEIGVQFVDQGLCCGDVELNDLLVRHLIQVFNQRT